MFSDYCLCFVSFDMGRCITVFWKMFNIFLVLPVIVFKCFLFYLLWQSLAIDPASEIEEMYLLLPTLFIYLFIFLCEWYNSSGWLERFFSF